MATKWKYECDCTNCANIKFVDDPEHHRHDFYCIPAIEGKKTVHADEDFVIRCDCYQPISTQASLFDT